MLNSILIKNLALIREAEINFEPGLNILTGETGSGKSIIINAINIALGGKASKSLIRSGSNSGLIELVFTTDREDILSILDEHDISRNGNEIIITRKITPDASISRINGETATLSVVRSITSRLVDIHGQHDHQSLLDPARHLDIVDSFGGDEIASLRKSVRSEYDKYKQLRKEMLSYNMDKEALSREISLLEHEAGEIEEAKLKIDEDRQLEAEYRQLSEWSGISSNLSRALYDIKNEDKGAFYTLMDADSNLKNAIEKDPENAELKSLLSTIRDLESVADDVSRDIENYINNHAFNEERFEEIKVRLDTINRLKEKYGNSIADILLYASRCREKLISYENYENSQKALLEQIGGVKTQLNIYARQLSEARKRSAAILEPMIIDSLKEMNFLSAEFLVDFRKNDKISENGFDKAEFLISVNPGEEPLPLARIASGGELSRIMLAVKSAIAVKDEMPTLIFDEIDTGISGKTAQKVSVKLSELSRAHQVICITHLPQIAAMADTHYAISKEVSDGTTISGAVKLDKEGMIYEIAKLLSGDSITETALSNASELKENSKSYKMQTK